MSKKDTEANLLNVNVISPNGVIAIPQEPQVEVLGTGIEALIKGVEGLIGPQEAAALRMKVLSGQEITIDDIKMIEQSIAYRATAKKMQGLIEEKHAVSPGLFEAARTGYQDSKRITRCNICTVRRRSRI